MIKSSITDATYPWWISPYKKSRSSSHAIQLFNIVSSSVGTPLSGYSPLSEANCKSYPPLSESYPNWSKQIVINTLKWRCYVSYYTKSTENIINNTLFTFRLNSVFFFFLIGIHPMQGWTATTRHGVTIKKRTKNNVYKEPTVKKRLLTPDLKPPRS